MERINDKVALDLSHNAAKKALQNLMDATQFAEDDRQAFQMFMWFHALLVFHMAKRLNPHEPDKGTRLIQFFAQTLADHAGEFGQERFGEKWADTDDPMFKQGYAKQWRHDA